MSLNIIVPVSGGLESTYLLQHAMTLRAKITVVFINVTGVGAGMVGELLTMNKTLDYFRSKDLDKRQYPGEIVDVIYYLAKPHLNIVSRGTPIYGELQTRQNNNINQQISVVLALAKVRTGIVSKSLGVECPTTLIGWLKEDCSDVSLDEYDFSAAEYQEFLNLPVLLGRLSNADRLAVPFRAPLWEMTKRQVWDKLDVELNEFIIPNGWDKYEEEFPHVIHTVHDNKKKEYIDAGIPFKDSYTIAVENNNLGFFVKLLLKMVSWKDLGLPQESRHLVRIVNEQPFMDYRENFIYESRLQNLKENFLSQVKELHEASSKFEWPKPPELIKDLEEELSDLRGPTTDDDLRYVNPAPPYKLVTGDEDIPLNTSEYAETAAGLSYARPADSPTGNADVGDCAMLSETSDK